MVCHGADIRLEMNHDSERFFVINVLEYLENAAAAYPDKRAFSDPETAVTFSELKDKADRIGTGLRAYFKPRQAVPVFLEKSPRAIEVFMGAVTAGCFYVQLDVRQPKERLKQILSVLGTDKVVTSSRERAALEALEIAAVIVDYETLAATTADREALSTIREEALDIDPLYGIFTSGSTGVPKGVVVNHRSVIDFIDVFADTFEFTSADIIGNQAPFDFDVSVKDIYTTLAKGCEMVIIPTKYFSIPKQLVDYLCDRHVTSLTWAVSALCLISQLHGLEYRVPTDIRRIMFSGEVMPIRQLNIWRKYLPNVRYVNLYGPTEITCNCTYYDIKRPFEVGEVLPIGRAFRNERVFLLDEADKKVTEADREGEICVSGTAVTAGYYNAPTQTALAFTQNPLNPHFPEIIYRTGDLGKYNGDGDLVFVSRKDFQIKHMGHRIELGEIDAAIEKISAVTRSCTLFINNKLVMYYTGDIDKKALSEQMKTFLPPYMIPNVFRQTDRLPMTKNAKIDRKALTNAYLTERRVSV